MIEQSKSIISKIQFLFFESKGVRYLSWIFKVTVFIVSLIYLYQHIANNQSFKDSFSQILALKLKWIEILWVSFLLLLLVLINWGIESWKWILLMRNYQKVEFKTAYKAILSGCASSLLFPNRSGEYFARMVYLKRSLRSKAVFTTMMASFAQLCATLLFGALSQFYFLFIKLKDILLIWPIVLLFGVFSFLLILIYFQMRNIHYVVPRKYLNLKVIRYINIFRSFSNKQLFQILSLSLLRYLTFCIQFIILLWMFNLDLSSLKSFMCISYSYLIQTIIPSSGLTELGIRGAGTIYIFGYFTKNLAPVLASSYIIYLFNVLIPAGIGSIFLLIQKKQDIKG